MTSSRHTWSTRPAAGRRGAIHRARLQVLLAAATALVLMWLGVAPAAAGRLAQPLDGTKNAVAETNLGDLVADAVRAGAEADFALVQASALQAVTIPAGDLSDDQIRAMLVFPEDTITVLKLTGGQVRDALERSLALLPYPNKGFLQISGLSVRFDAGRAPGARVIAITVAAGGAPLDPNHTYRVAVPESLAKGALGYFRVFNSVPRERTDLALSRALTRFTAGNKSLPARVEGRLQPQ